MSEMSKKIQSTVGSALAKAAVIRALTHPSIKFVNFMCGSYYVSEFQLRRVKASVESGLIPVKFDPSIGGGAEYDTGTNTIHLSFSSSSLTRDALIVHECVHAAFDLDNLSDAKVDISEASAYIAQCIVARQRSEDPSQRLMSDHAGSDKVFEIAWKIAGDVIASKGAAEDDQKALREALKHHRHYGGHTNDNAGYNGVSRP
jgi:hypothetical protein